MQAADILKKTLQIELPEEAIRRTTEGIGQVAEAEEQQAMGRARAGQEPVDEAEVQAFPDSLVVEVDGAMVHTEEDWHEMKVGVVAPLGPELRTDPETGRVCMKLGEASYCAGLQAVEAFWYRVYVQACRQGLASPQSRLVVVLGDGADWIWRYARAFLAVGRAEVVQS